MTEAERAKRDRRILYASHFHEAAMLWADLADELMRRGDHDEAVRVYRRAWVDESQAASVVAPFLDCEPTRSVLHRSAACLAISAGLFDEAEQLIAIGLAGMPPAQIADELLELRGKVETRK